MFYDNGHNCISLIKLHAIGLKSWCERAKVKQVYAIGHYNLKKINKTKM